MYSLGCGAGDRSISINSAPRAYYKTTSLVVILTWTSQLLCQQQSPLVELWLWLCVVSVAESFSVREEVEQLCFPSFLAEDRDWMMLCKQRLHRFSRWRALLLLPSVCLTILCSVPEVQQLPAGSFLYFLFLVFGADEVKMGMCYHDSWRHF